MPYALKDKIVIKPESLDMVIVFETFELFFLLFLMNRPLNFYVSREERKGSMASVPTITPSYKYKNPFENIITHMLYIGIHNFQEHNRIL
jgi:hypothetical protein